jgi:hypothetical protein
MSYTIETSGTCQYLKDNNIPVTRENFIKEAFPDGTPDPWLVEYEAELPEELQDWSIFGKKFMDGISGNPPDPDEDEDPDDDEDEDLDLDPDDDEDEDEEK